MTGPLDPVDAAGPVPPGVLAVHAHPDDETLSTGTLLATWAAAGGRVTLVTCTRGERGEVIGHELAHLEGDGPALAAHRTGELAAAAAALGVTDRAWLDELPGPGAPSDDATGRAAPTRQSRYEDSGMVWLAPGRAGAAPDSGAAAFARADVAVAAARLAGLIRAYRPGVVVTYEPGGGYGHPDHVQAHAVTMRAVELAADPSVAVPGAPFGARVVLWAALDAAQRTRGESEVREMAAVDPAPGLTPAAVDRVAPSAAVPSDQVDLRVDVLPVLDRVVGALRAHATQVQGVRVWPEQRRGAAVGRLALSDGVLQPLLRHEVYRVVRGPAAAVPWPAGVTVVGRGGASGRIA